MSSYQIMQGIKLAGQVGHALQQNKKGISGGFNAIGDILGGGYRHLTSASLNNYSSVHAYNHYPNYSPRGRMKEIPNHTITLNIDIVNIKGKKAVVITGYQVHYEDLDIPTKQYKAKDFPKGLDVKQDAKKFELVTIKNTK
jgi:hypothetical protein